MVCSVAMGTGDGRQRHGCKEGRPFPPDCRGSQGYGVRRFPAPSGACQNCMNVIPSLGRPPVVISGSGWPRQLKAESRFDHAG